jgi:hypothetical protein
LTRAKNRLILSSFRKIKDTESQKLKLDLRNCRCHYCNTTSSIFILECGSDMPTAERGEDWLATLNVE